MRKRSSIMPIEFGRLQDAQFYIEQDGELKPLGSLNEVELTTIEEDNTDNVQMRYLDTKPFSTSFTIDDKSVEEIWKYVVFGGDRGRYNGYVLHRDGYLSPENAWMVEET